MPVYIAQHRRKGHIKIGYSARPEARAHGLGAELLAVVSLSNPIKERHFERMLLGTFEAWSIGGEWFSKLPADALNLIEVRWRQIHAGRFNHPIWGKPAHVQVDEVACFEAFLARVA